MRETGVPCDGTLGLAEDRQAYLFQHDDLVWPRNVRCVIGRPVSLRCVIKRLGSSQNGLKFEPRRVSKPFL